MFRTKFAALAAAALLVAASAHATNYAVGTCLPTLTSYTTISQAVSTVPSGSVIEVCPGSYPEQVVITRPLTLEGVPGTSGEAVIVAPPGGLTQTITLPVVYGQVAYQVLVQSAGTVNFSNLAIDGSLGSNIDNVIGVVYLDSSGRADHLSVRNQINSINGVGILAITSAPTPQTVTITSSVIRGFSGAAVWAVSGDALVTANVDSSTINGKQPPGWNWTIGLWYYNASGTVQLNQITGTFSGFYIVTSSSVNATQNNVTGLANSELQPAYAFLVSQSPASVTNNTIDAGGNFGIFLEGQGNNSAIQHNTIANSPNAVMGCDIDFSPPPASGFVVTSNTIIDAATGLQMPSGNTTAPNNYYAVATATSPCT